MKRLILYYDIMRKHSNIIKFTTIFLTFSLGLAMAHNLHRFKMNRKQ